MIAPDEFAEVIERMDNLRGALEIPMPVEFHVNQMKRELEEVSDKLKRIYVEEEDENPWDKHGSKIQTQGNGIVLLQGKGIIPFKKRL